MITLFLHILKLQKRSHKTAAVTLVASRWRSSFFFPCLEVALVGMYSAGLTNQTAPSCEKSAVIVWVWVYEGPKSTFYGVLYMWIESESRYQTKNYFSFTGCPVDPSRRRAADGMHSHIITPREVTRGFSGGSLSSRNILQLNGKLFNPQPTKSCLYSYTNVSFNSTFINARLHSPCSVCLNACAWVYSTPWSN